MNNQFNQGNQQQFQQTTGFSQFGMSHPAFQPGFSNTNAQEVRQQNAQSAQGGSNVQQSGVDFGGSGFDQFSGTHAASQPEFAGSNVQEVTQRNAQSSQGQSFNNIF